MEGRRPAALQPLALPVAELAADTAAGMQAADMTAERPAADMLAAEAVPEHGILPAVPLVFFREAGECQLRSQ